MYDLNKDKKNVVADKVLRKKKNRMEKLAEINFAQEWSRIWPSFKAKKNQFLGSSNM